VTIVNPPRSYPVRSVAQGRPVAMTMEMLNGFGQTNTETIIEKEVVDWKTVGTFAALAIILVLVLSSGSKDQA
jgi:hypothetical protein